MQEEMSVSCRRCRLRTYDCFLGIEEERRSKLAYDGKAFATPYTTGSLLLHGSESQWPCYNC